MARRNIESSAKFMGSKLTPRQERFARAYVVTGNATSAALEAGYTASNPSQLAWQQLQKPTVQVAIQQHRLRIQSKHTGIEETIIHGLFQEAMHAPMANDRIAALIILAQITGLLPRRVRRKH